MCRYSVLPEDISSLANNALIFRQGRTHAGLHQRHSAESADACCHADTADPRTFAQDLVLALARMQREAAAKALGYFINGNVTFGGG